MFVRHPNAMNIRAMDFYNPRAANAGAMDFTILANRRRTSAADFNEDGVVDIGDFAILVHNYNLSADL